MHFAPKEFDAMTLEKGLFLAPPDPASLPNDPA
jgi:hypothetical protein